MALDPSDSQSPRGSQGFAGLGTAIVEVVRIGDLIQRFGERFLCRVYSDDEIRECHRNAQYLQHFAAFWTVKEAVLKTLGHARPQAAAYRDVEVRPSQNGHVSVALHGRARAAAEKHGLGDFHVSLAFCRAYATATVIAWRR